MLVFFSEEVKKGEMIVEEQGDLGQSNRWFIIFLVGIALVMIFPIFGLANRVEPRVLGMPFSMFWVIFWIGVEFFGLIAFFLLEDKRRSR